MSDDTPVSGDDEHSGHSEGRGANTALRPADAEGLARLWDYVKQHSTSQVPHRHKTADGFWLGVWVCGRRKNRGEDHAFDQLLESLPGWTWAPHERAFEERLAHYKDVTEAGRLNRHRALYVWASAQRRLVREGEMSADRLEQLRAAGIILMCMCIAIALKPCAPLGFRGNYCHTYARLAVRNAQYSERNGIRGNYG